MIELILGLALGLALCQVQILFHQRRIHRLQEQLILGRQADELLRDMIVAVSRGERFGQLRIVQEQPEASQGQAPEEP